MKALHDSLPDHKICLAYLGSFDDTITDKLIGISEFYLENRSGLGNLKNKVSFLIAECFQNVVRHGEAKQVGRSDFFKVSILSDRTILASCNLVAEHYVADIEKQIIQVNSLDAEGLKKLQKDVLSNEAFTDKGGAGLGLIEMARKSGLPLKYSFHDVGDGFKRFFLVLEIVSKHASGTKTSIADIERFYNSLADDKVMMLYKGDLSMDIIIPLVEMVQDNFSDIGKGPGKEKRGVTTLIECLQNVSRHGKGINGSKEGIFTLARSGTSYVINIGNPMDAAKQASLDKTLTTLKSMNAEALKSLYNKTLLEPRIPSEGNCGLGLIEIARNAEGKFDHSFIPSAEDESFYTINITI